MTLRPVRTQETLKRHVGIVVVTVLAPVLYTRNVVAQPSDALSLFGYICSIASVLMFASPLVSAVSDGGVRMSGVVGGVIPRRPFYLAPCWRRNTY